jgi:hypothetical protein
MWRLDVAQQMLDTDLFGFLCLDNGCDVCKGFLSGGAVLS